MRRNQHQAAAVLVPDVPPGRLPPTLPRQLTLPTHPTHPLGAVAADPLTADDPEELGAYQLIGRLGEGGMGTVYLGIGPIDADEPGGAGAPGAAVIGPAGIDGDLRLVAIKMIRADLARLPEFRERFLREADVARRVARFCTAEVLEVVDPPHGPPYLVTEYIDGLTLTRAVLAGGPLRTGDLERLAVSVAAALTAIHGAGLVHRDLKPSNVILSSLGPRVIDFGIARATDARGVLSHDIQRIGTPAFMAPEQASGQPVTAAADIFAWGGLVTYAGTGVLPFGDGPTPVQLYRVVHQEPALDTLPPTLRPIVDQAMCKDPAGRPSAQELFLRLVSMGPPTHPDPAVSRAIRAGRIPTAARTGRPAAPGGAAATRPLPGPDAVPAEAGPPTARDDPGRAARVAAGLRAMLRARFDADEPAARPRPAPVPGTGRDRWRARIRHGSLLVVPLLALLLMAVLIPVVLQRPPQATPTPATAATELAASAEKARATEPALAGRLSLAAFRISPTPAARAALRTSFAATAASTLTGQSGAVVSVALSADGRLAATGSADGTTRLWRLPGPAGPGTVTPLATVTSPNGYATAVAFSPSGSLLAIASSDRAVVLWDVTVPERPARVSTLPGPSGAVASVAFSPDGRFFANSGYDDTVVLWDLADPAHPRALGVAGGHSGWVRQVAFSPDGGLLATASTDRTAALWDLADPALPRRLATLTGQSDYVSSVAFTPDGRQVATGDYDGTTVLWDVTDPARPVRQATVRADPDPVLAVAFGPDGRTLAVAGRDDTVHLWDVATPERPAPAGVIAGHTDWVQSVAFTPDGRSLLTGSADLTARLTPLDDATVLATACRDRAGQFDPDQWHHYVPGIPYRPGC